MSSTVPPTDPELLKRFASDRDPEAFAELVSRHYGVVTGIGRRVLGDAHEAEDIAQATFLLLAEKARGLKGRDSAGIARWIVGATYGLAKNRRRVLGNRRTRELEFARQQAEQDDPGIAETVATVDDAIAKLPEKFRDAIIARYLRGLSYREAAQELRVSKDTIRGRLVQAKAMLRKQLSAAGTSGFMGVLASAGNSDAAPPSDFALHIVHESARESRWAFSGFAGWKSIVGVSSVGLLIGTYFLSTPKLGKTEGSKPIDSVAKQIGLTVERFEIPARPDRVAEWDDLIEDRLSSPLATVYGGIADEDNGYFALVRLNEAFEKYRDERGKDWMDKIAETNAGFVPWDTAFVAEAVASFEPLFAIVDEILEAPEFEFPRYRLGQRLFQSPNTVFYHFMGLRSKMLAQEGDLAGALAENSNLLSIADKFATGKGSMMYGIMGNTQTYGAQERILSLLDEYGEEIPRGSLDRISELTQILAPANETRDVRFGAEYAFHLRYIRQFLSGELPPEYLGSLYSEEITILEENPRVIIEALQNLDLSRLADNMDDIRIRRAQRVFDFTKDYGSLDAELVGRLPKRFKVSELSPEETADLAALTFIGDSEKSLTANAGTALALQRLLQTRIALERAWRDGIRIDALEKLVPGYLPEIPLDPYDEKPLKYGSERRVLYSIGKDRIDSGGVADKEGAMRDFNEIVIPLPDR